jgi:hypothetical protein
MTTCFCLGPQNGEPLCPCQMRAAREHPGVAQPMYTIQAPHGCVCPPGAERTCQGPGCPRQPLRITA